MNFVLQDAVGINLTQMEMDEAVTELNVAICITNDEFRIHTDEFCITMMNVNTNAQVNVQDIDYDSFYTWLMSGSIVPTPRNIYTELHSPNFNLIGSKLCIMFPGVGICKGKEGSLCWARSVLYKIDDFSMGMKNFQ